MLSEIMPLLQNMGVQVVEERPYTVTSRDGAPAWIERFVLRPVAPGTTLDVDGPGAIFQDAFGAVVTGSAENDTFNGLVLAAGLAWREVAVLRAYSHYLRQAGTPFSQDYIASALVAHPDISRALVTLFHDRFDPKHAAGAEAIHEQQVADLTTALDAVTSLDYDRILRALLRLVLATLRTNAFNDTPGAPMAFKLDPTVVPELPKPLPMFEIFVASPRVEGVHLRAGRVARGGIRWSDRREDFRTEILGLMKAQTVKNAVIVPVGAKGGFVVKAPRPTATRSRPRSSPATGRSSARSSSSPTTSSTASRCHPQEWCATTATTRTSSSRPTRAPPPSPTSPTRSRSSTTSGSATHSRRAARWDSTTRRWASPPRRGSR